MFSGGLNRFWSNIENLVESMNSKYVVVVGTVLCRAGLSSSNGAECVAKARSRIIL
jgi:hypothetical protein